MLRQHPAWLATGATAEVSSNCSGAGGLPLFLKDHQRSGPADVVFLVNCHRVYPTWWSVAVPRFFKMDIGWGWKCGWLCWMPPDWEKLEGQHCFRLVCQRGNNNWSTAGALKLFFLYRTGHNHFFTELVSLESFGYGSGCSLPEDCSILLCENVVVTDYSSQSGDWLCAYLQVIVLWYLIKDPLSLSFVLGQLRHLSTKHALSCLYCICNIQTCKEPYAENVWLCFTLRTHAK